jgi:hypothetical protein
MKASLWGARLMALPSTSGCLGASCFETFMRSACLEWLRQTVCSYAGYLGVSTPYVQDLHIFMASVSTVPDITTSVTTSLTTSSCDAPSRSRWVSSDTGHRQFKASSRTAHLTWPPRGRPCQTPCSYAKRSGCLYTSFDQDHDPVFFSF